MAVPSFSHGKKPPKQCGGCLLGPGMCLPLVSSLFTEISVLLDIEFAVEEVTLRP